MSITRQPCIMRGSKFYCFVVDIDKKRALILDNFVWAVATKEIPIAEWRKEWKVVQLPDEKVEKILQGLSNYALYAGMTPEAAEYLPQLYPMSTSVIAVARHKGEETLAQFKTQAAAEEASDKTGRKLTGAALASVAAKEMEKIEAAQKDPAPKPKTEPSIDEDYLNQPPRDTIEEKHLSTDKAKKAKKLAREVSKELTEAEARGENPAKLMKSSLTGPTKKAVLKAEKTARAKPFDATKLKGSDGQYKSVSAMFKGLLIENETKKTKLTDDQIFEAVRKKFGIDESKRGYVSWNRNWLKKEGVIK